jgi:endonuclease YncB( thermonuclease family)
MFSTMKNPAFLSGLYLLMAFAVVPVQAIACDEHAKISGKVVSVSDGDTLTLLTADKQQIKVRIHGIDAPENSQPYGQKAKQELSSLCFGTEAKLLPVEKDRYKRTVAQVTCREKDAGVEMVKQGAAWAYRKYSKNTKLLAAEQEAQEKRVGISALQEDQRVPPWEWRRKR